MGADVIVGKGNIIFYFILPPKRKQRTITNNNKNIKDKTFNFDFNFKTLPFFSFFRYFPPKIRLNVIKNLHIETRKCDRWYVEKDCCPGRNWRKEGNLLRRKAKKCEIVACHAFIYLDVWSLQWPKANTNKYLAVLFQIAKNPRGNVLLFIETKDWFW